MEALVALGLLALVIGLVAGLAREYSAILSFSASKDATNRAGDGLEQISREVEQSSEVVTPTMGGLGASDRLVFHKLNLSASDRYQAWVPPDYQPWQPKRSNDLLTISYFLEGGDLLRQLDQNGQPARRSVVVPGVNDFSVVYPSLDCVQLKLSMQEKRLLRTYASEAHRWSR